MTLVWFFVWLIWNAVGDHEPLLADPVNFWLGSLIFAIAVDLSGSHAAGQRKCRPERRERPSSPAAELDN